MERIRDTRGSHSAEEFGSDESRLEDIQEGTSIEHLPAAEPSFDPAAAEEIWRIAARLQAEAARRLENRSRAIADSPDSGIVTGSFSLSEVKLIADEAGIDPQYIELALREHTARRLSPTTVSPGKYDTAGRFLGTPEDHVTVTRVVRADKRTVLKAMERLFPAEPYNLQLLEVIGDEHDLADSTLIFKVPQTEEVVTGSGVNMFAYRMSIADLNRMTVSLHAIDDKRTEVTVQLDLKYGKWRNFKLGAWIAGVFGAFAGLLALLIAAKKSALGFVGLSTVTAMITFLVGYGSYWVYRVAYRSGIKKGHREIEELLAQVDVGARTGGGFTKG